MIQGHALPQKADSPPRGPVAERLAQHPAAAGRGKHQAHGDMDGGSFTSAIRAKKAKDFTRLHAQGKVLECGHPVAMEEAAVLLADAIEFEGRVGPEALRIAARERLPKSPELPKLKDGRNWRLVVGDLRFVIGDL